jgi:hypothetical protein
MMTTLLLIAVSTVLFVGILLLLAYRETDLDPPQRHCAHHHHPRSHA